MAACCVSADGKCELRKSEEDERARVYSCVEAVFDDVKDISREADEIQFSVSKLEIPAKAFADFRLRKLSFFNCVFKRIDAHAFEGLVDLEQLTIFESNINDLWPSWFEGLHGLKSLSLKNNNLVYIEPTTFLELRNLQHLNLENNSLNCLPVNTVATLRRLTHFQMGRNPWLCSCHEELVRWAMEKNIDLEISGFNKMRFECMVESSRTEVKVSIASPAEKPQNIALTGKDACERKTLPILWPSPNNVTSIELSGVDIEKITEFAFFQFGNSLRSLNLSSCNITEIDPKAFAGLPKLERLILSNNLINTVKAEWFTDLRNLRVLVLDRNEIKLIEPGAFPLLDKLEILSLEQNAIECLSGNTFGMMRLLKQINIATNPWNCSCFDDFTSWLSNHQIAYHMSWGSCTSGNMQGNRDHRTNGGGQGSGYWRGAYRNETFSYSYNFSTTNNEVYTKYENYDYYRRNSKDMMHGGQHQRGKKSVNNAQYQTEHHQRNQREVLFNGRRCQLANACQPRCDRIVMQSLCASCHKCVGGSTLELNDKWRGVPDTAESIEFKDSRISVISNYTFHRFGGNLRRLSFENCEIQRIEPQAFAGLYNLQELILTGNRIIEVRESWFQSTTNLQRLILTDNYIQRIENGVFQHLRYLQHLGISNNMLNCIGIDLLDQMPMLKWMDVDNNPWSCVCRDKLIQWMDEHHVDYNRNFWRGSPNPLCVHPPTPIPTIPTQPPPPPPPRYYDPPPTPQGRCVKTGIASFSCTCDEGNTFDPNQIPLYAERVVINSVKLHLKANAFSHLKYLKELVIKNCSIEYISNSAFHRLSNLEWLIFHGNNIPIIRSIWFRDLTALTKLDLSGNHVKEIEADTFVSLLNLRELLLHNNEIQCIYTKSVDGLKKLNQISLHNNLLTWRCFEEWKLFLAARKISSEEFIQSYDEKSMNCELDGEPEALPRISAGATDTSISTVNVVCVSIAMLIFTKF